MTKKIDNIDIKKAWKSSEGFYRGILSDLKPGLYIHGGQPGTGKTESIVKAIATSKIKVAFFTSNHSHIFTSNHSHIEKFKCDLGKYKVSPKEYIHGKGFEKNCLRYPQRTKSRRLWTRDEEYVHRIYKTIGVGYTRFLCKGCSKRTICEYYTYTQKVHTYRISLQPLEYLYPRYNDDKDVFIIDEAISKSERLHWDFKYNRLCELTETVAKLSGKPHPLKQYVSYILEIHRTLMQHTSLIFTEEPTVLFSMDDTNFQSDDYKKRYFIQKKCLVTHPVTTSLESHLSNEVRKRAFELCQETILKRFLIPIKREIENAIKENDDSKLNRLLERYIPLDKWFRFLKILLFKQPSYDSALVLSERLQTCEYIDLKDKDCQTTRENEDHEWGFIDECPYIKDKKSGQYIISNMGKAYQSTIGNPDQAPDSWFTIGHPFLFKVLDIALTKPVILLDATFDEKIFKKLRCQWLMLNTTDINVKNPSLSSHEKSDKISSEYKYNVSINKSSIITNKKSIVYDVENAFSLSTLESGKLKEVIPFIATIVDKNPGKKIAIICKKRFEKVLQSKFDKSIVLHFFGQRGKTIECDILFVVGTPFLPPGSYFYEYILAFNEFPKSTEKKDGKSFNGFKDPLLQKIFHLNVSDEVYHALHRTRILFYNREAYAMCLLPEKIQDEVTVKKIPYMDAISRLPGVFLMEMIIKDEGGSKTFFDEKVKNRKQFKLAGGWKTIIDYMLKTELIILKTKKSKTRHITTIYSTNKGRGFHKRYKKHYDCRVK